MNIQQAIDLVHQAIDKWNPSSIVCAFSGGYDSMVTTHIINNHREAFNIPVRTMSIDTGLTADGWREYIDKTANRFGWGLFFEYGDIESYKNWVKVNGQPYSRKGHHYAYNRLKDRAFDATLKRLKNNWRDKVLFVSGLYRAESTERQKLTEPIQRKRESNAIFVNPCFYWQKGDFLQYRLDHDLPTNPFYDTVGGSGDCQCNWGRFITLRKLQKYSPQLAAGNVGEIDSLSKEFHGYGWDGTPAGQTEMFATFEDNSKGVSPFLCANCSRDSYRQHGKNEAERLAQMRIEGW